MSKKIGEYSVEGYTSLTDFTLPNRKGIFVYVNKRWIRDRMISHAILEALRPVVPKERYPRIEVFWFKS